MYVRTYMYHYTATTCMYVRANAITLQLHVCMYVHVYLNAITVQLHVCICTNITVTTSLRIYARLCMYIFYHT